MPIPPPPSSPPPHTHTPTHTLVNNVKMIKYKLLALHLLRDCPITALDTACDGNLSTSLAVGSFVGCVRQSISMATARELTVLRVFLHAVFRLPYNDWLPVAVRGTDKRASIRKRDFFSHVFHVCSQSST